MQVSFDSALRRRARPLFHRPRQGRGALARGRTRRAPRPIGRPSFSALVREAEEYGADALIEVNFEVDEVAGADIDGVPLSRIVAAGSAVRFAVAA